MPQSSAGDRPTDKESHFGSAQIHDFLLRILTASLPRGSRASHIPEPRKVLPLDSNLYNLFGLAFTHGNSE
jgi:hypothetical protein